MSEEKRLIEARCAHDIFWQHDERCRSQRRRSEAPTAGAGDGGLHLLLDSGVAMMRSMNGKLRGASRSRASARRGLYAGGVDVNGQQQANCIRQNVALAASTFLQRHSRTRRAKPLTAPLRSGCR